MSYRFHVVCPNCNRVSETVQDQFVPEPHVSCGDCLMDHCDVVQMKVVKVEAAGLTSRKEEI